MNRIPLLFVHYGDDWIRGSEVALLNLVASLDRARFSPILWCNSPALEEAAVQAGLQTYRSHFDIYLDYDSPRPNPASYVRLVRAGREICRRHGIRVIHANGAAPVQWLFPTARSERIPLLCHLHTEYLRRSRYALGLHTVTQIVGVSNAVVAGLRHDGLTADRVSVIYNGVDNTKPCSGSQFRQNYGIAESAFVVGSAGSFIRRKGHDILLRAFATLDDSSHLLLASDGPERAALTALIETLGLAGRVHLVGHLSDMAPLYAAADVFALASRAEAFGLVLAEAGAQGLPVVSTTVGGISEVVLQGETGLLSPAEDIDAFAANLRLLRNDRPLRARLGDAARTRVRDHFSLDSMTSHFESTYERLAGTPKDELGWTDLLTRRLKPYAGLLSRGA